jgi:hypothetical protein
VTRGAVGRRCWRHDRHGTALYIGEGKCCRVLRSGRSVELDVGLQGLAEVGGEDRDLLQLEKFIATGEALVELVDVAVERAVEAEVA